MGPTEGDTPPRRRLEPWNESARKSGLQADHRPAPSDRARSAIAPSAKRASREAPTDSLPPTTRLARATVESPNAEERRGHDRALTHAATRRRATDWGCVSQAEMAASRHRHETPGSKTPTEGSSSGAPQPLDSSRRFDPVRRHVIVRVLADVHLDDVPSTVEQAATVLGEMPEVQPLTQLLVTLREGVDGLET